MERLGYIRAPRFVIPREGVERFEDIFDGVWMGWVLVIPREGVESFSSLIFSAKEKSAGDPERGS